MFFFFGCAVCNHVGKFFLFYRASKKFCLYVEIIVFVQDCELCSYKMELCPYEL